MPIEPIPMAATMDMVGAAMLSQVCSSYVSVCVALNGSHQDNQCLVFQDASQGSNQQYVWLQKSDSLSPNSELDITIGACGDAMPMVTLPVPVRFSHAVV